MICLPSPTPLLASCRRRPEQPRLKNWRSFLVTEKVGMTSARGLISQVVLAESYPRPLLLWSSHVFLLGILNCHNLPHLPRSSDQWNSTVAQTRGDGRKDDRSKMSQSLRWRDSSLKSAFPPHHWIPSLPGLGKTKLLSTTKDLFPRYLHY